MGEPPKKDPKAPPTEPPRPARRSTNPPRGERVTLTFAGPPLSLPGEKPALHRTSGTFELALGDEVLLPEHGSEPPGDHAPTVDAWTRDKRSRGSDVHADVQRIGSPPLEVPAGVWSDSRDSADTTTARAPHARLDAAREEAPEESGVDALNLVARTRVPKHTIDLVAEMRDRYALGDFTGALRTADLLLGRRPDLEEVARIRDAARQRLEELYRSRIGAEGDVFEVMVPAAEVRWLGIDSSAAHVLECIDGRRTIDEIVGASGMDRLEVMKSLAHLIDTGAIRAR
jgi:hypothetical protein